MPANAAWVQRLHILHIISAPASGVNWAICRCWKIPNLWHHHIKSLATSDTFQTRYLTPDTRPNLSSTAAEEVLRSRSEHSFVGTTYDTFFFTPTFSTEIKAQCWACLPACAEPFPRLHLYLQCVRPYVVRASILYYSIQRIHVRMWRRHTCGYRTMTCAVPSKFFWRLRSPHRSNASRSNEGYEEERQIIVSRTRTSPCGPHGT